ncbi:MAG: plasmid maintenance protein CcdB [Holophaga sp.]|nr:plasmid maintenance protein CcdB [Holophaga sp.]
MASFSVHANANPVTCGTIPFLLDVQSEVLSGLGTRLMVPLYRRDAVPGPPIASLTPVLTFQGVPLVAMFPEMAGVPRRCLGAQVGELAAARPEVMAAMDLMLAGF